MSESELREQVAVLQQEVFGSQLEQARAEAIRQYPAAAPVADLLVGNSAEDILSMAALVSERLAVRPLPDVNTPAGETARFGTSDEVGEPKYREGNIASTGSGDIEADLVRFVEERAARP